MKDKIILLTGGTGSFGQMFAEIALRECNLKAIRIFSRGEFLQQEMERKFNDSRLRFFIGDVRDKGRLYRAMTDVDIVIHAAALKQVPACEYNPIEAIRTNIEGAVNIIDAALDQGAEKVLAISSDKAVHPINLYGATKLVAEKLFIQANVYGGKFSCVRYGNVTGSRGSVVPLWEKQKDTGIITITDQRATRFWLSLEDGVRFVIRCLGRMGGGEIFIPKIPRRSIVDLADKIAPQCKKEYIGLRPGEKLHEVLITEDEAPHTREFDDYFVIGGKGGKPLPEGFRYASGGNSSI